MKLQPATRPHGLVCFKYSQPTRKEAAACPSPWSTPSSNPSDPRFLEEVQQAALPPGHLRWPRSLVSCPPTFWPSWGLRWWREGRGWAGCTSSLYRLPDLLEVHSGPLMAPSHYPSDRVPGSFWAARVRLLWRLTGPQGRQYPN